MTEQTIEINVDASSLDTALKKADRLRACLREADQLLASIQAKSLEPVGEPVDGAPFTHRRIHNLEIKLGPSMCDTDQIANELTAKLREWTERAIR